MQDLLSNAKAVLSATPGRWVDLAEKIPEDLLQLPAAPGEWSALDCLGHLLDTEQWVFPVRVRAFLAGEDITAFDPDTQGQDRSQQAPRQLAHEFARLRAENLALLEEVTSSDLSRAATHSELGRVTLGEMLHEWAAHDLMHTVQAERALMQPFIPGCGPWQESFADHDLRSAKRATG